MLTLPKAVTRSLNSKTQSELTAVDASSSQWPIGGSLKSPLTDPPTQLGLWQAAKAIPTKWNW